jgi:succinate dehydrogenase / fumarate reductase cytochrome b subunit
MAEALKPRPTYRNIHVTQILKYRLPPAGIVSILHRVSGALMFLLLPFIVWLLDVSLTSEISYEQFTAAFGVASDSSQGGL